MTKEGKIRFLLVPDGTYIPVLEAAFIGLVAGASAIALSAGVNWLGTLRLVISEGHKVSEVLPLFGLIGGLVAGLLVQMAPEISGSGIPQVRAALNRLKMTMNLKTALLKLAGGTIALGSGFFMGREGPTVQVGAAIAAQLSRWFPSTEEHRRQLIAAGAGAGLTAAFNAPLAGCIFVIEELLKEAKPTTIILSIVACFSATLVHHLFGHQHAHYATEGAVSELIEFHLKDVPFYIFLGIVCGFFGAIFNAGILLFLRLYRRSNKIPLAVKTAFAGLVSGLIVSFLPDTLHNYAETRLLLNAGTLNSDLVPVVFVTYMLLTLIAYGSSAPGGLFAPLLALGSAIGYTVGYADMYFVGGSSIQTFALVGMGALFAGAARVPLTAIVIVFEMVGNFNLVAPLMLAAVVANIVGERINKGSLYDLLMVWNGIHLHSPDSTKLSIQTLKAKDIVSQVFRSVQGDALMKDVFATIDSTGQPGVPVVENGKLVGVVTRIDLSHLPSRGESANTPVTMVMRKNPVSVSPVDTLEDILFLFACYHFNWLPVTQDDVYQGTISRHDVVTALFSESSDKPVDVEATVQELQINKEEEP